MANDIPQEKGFIESKREDGFYEVDIVTAHKKIDVYLTQEVKSGANYTALVNKLRNLHEEDIVNFYIGNFGGSCHGLIHLISAIKASKAKEINMIVVSPSYSAGSSLALAGTSLQFEPYTFLMFHNYSSSTSGKGGELVKGVLESDAWIKDYFKKLHMPFLTKDECKTLENDKDVYVHYNDKDLKKRLDRHFRRK